MTPLQFLLHQIDLIDGCETTKRAVLDVMRRQAGQVIRFAKKDLTKPMMVDFARRLLADRSYSRAQVRDRLCARYSIAEGTAYSIISRAIGTPPANCENFSDSVRELNDK